jgi:hypothetical protein
VDAEKVVGLCGYAADKLLKMKVVANFAQGRCSVWVDGKKVLKTASFTKKVNESQLVSFRTGAYRQLWVGKGENADDLPNAGDAVPEAVYYLNNVSIVP